MWAVLNLNHKIYNMPRDENLKAVVRGRCEQKLKDRVAAYGSSRGKAMAESQIVRLAVIEFLERHENEEDVQASHSIVARSIRKASKPKSP